MSTEVEPSPPSPPSSAQDGAPPSPLGPHVPTPHSPSYTGAIFSYLVPGLGQILQGRVAKGLLFLVCIYTLFFYGYFLGSAEAKAFGRTFRVSGNVYVPDKWQEESPDRPRQDTGPNLLQFAFAYPRPQVVGQFFVGVAFWPAIIQYYHARDIESPNEADRAITRLYIEADGLMNKGEEADAREYLDRAQQMEAELEQKHRHPILGDFMREPTAEATNVIFNAGDKRLEIGWVFTVIAGVLNVLVIFDAFMGPAYTSAEEARRKAN